MKVTQGSGSIMEGDTGRTPPVLGSENVIIIIIIIIGKVITGETHHTTWRT